MKTEELIKELRLGNHITFNDTYVTVNHLSKFVIGWNETNVAPVDKQWFKPILLTTDWLRKLGFTDGDYKKGYIGIDYKAGMVTTDFTLTKPEVMGEFQLDYCFQFDTGSISKYIELKYVHQLQNLFFTITGKELTINI